MTRLFLASIAILAAASALTGPVRAQFMGGGLPDTVIQEMAEPDQSAPARKEEPKPRPPGAGLELRDVTWQLDRREGILTLRVAGVIANVSHEKRQVQGLRGAIMRGDTVVQKFAIDTPSWLLSPGQSTKFHDELRNLVVVAKKVTVGFADSGARSGQRAETIVVARKLPTLEPAPVQVAKAAPPPAPVVSKAPAPAPKPRKTTITWNPPPKPAPKPAPAPAPAKVAAKAPPAPAPKPEPAHAPKAPAPAAAAPAAQPAPPAEVAALTPLPPQGASPFDMPSIDGHRLALVIGNSKYKSGRLENPYNDAKLISGTLKRVGFEVIEVLDATQLQMKRAIQRFGAKLDHYGKNAIALFYYAGHGIQAGGRNYLIPVNAVIQRESDLDIEGVPADWVIQQLEFAKSALNLIILDACRNNPFSTGFRSVQTGLARMDAPTGTLIAYSTAPGDVAADGDGRNSPYSQALARAMLVPGTPVEQAFKEVRVYVRRATKGAQTPWEASSLTGDFYFIPSKRQGRR